MVTGFSKRRDFTRRFECNTGVDAEAHSVCGFVSVPLS